MCLPLQLDKKNEVVLRDSEDSIIEFETGYQVIVQEANEIQERYKSERALAVTSRIVLTPLFIGQFSSKYVALGSTFKLEESQVKMNLRLAQLDDWIAQSRKFVTETDKKVHELHDVFEMMTVSLG